MEGTQVAFKATGEAAVYAHRREADGVDGGGRGGTLGRAADGRPWTHPVAALLSRRAPPGAKPCAVFSCKAKAPPKTYPHHPGLTASALLRLAL